VLHPWCVCGPCLWQGLFSCPILGGQHSRRVVSASGRRPRIWPRARTLMTGRRTRSLSRG